MHVKVLLKHTAKWRVLYLLTFIATLSFFGVNAFDNYQPTVMSDKDDYAPGEIAIITGVGWTQDSLVDIHLEEEPAYHGEHEHDYHNTVVNADGTWRIEYPIEERHLGVKFTVIAEGKQSGAKATTVFTDGFVRVRSASSVITFKVDYKVTSTSDCSGLPISQDDNQGNPSSQNDVVVNYSTDGTTLYNVSPGDKDSPTQYIQITAETTSDQGGIFLNWTGPNGFTSNNPTICISGTNPTRLYTANYSTCTVPEITVPSNIIINSAAGECGSNVNYNATITGTSPTLNYTFTGATTGSGRGTGSGSPFNVGETTVTVNATNTCGTDSESFTVTVVDNQTPVLIAAANQEVSLGEECSIVIPDVRGTATDNCGATITQDPVAGTVVAATNDQTIAVVVTATDAAGNTDEATVNISAKDETNPTITAPVAIRIAANASCQAIGVILGEATAGDNCSVASVTNNAPATFSLGETEVIWTVTDAAGLTATATQTVTVVDQTAPIAAPIATVRGECSATVTEVPTAEDNCGGTINGTTNDPLTYSQQGRYEITWSFNDGNGNISTAIQEVFVDDVTAPLIPTLADATGECSVTLTAPTTTDNCAGTITGTTTDPTTYNEQGNYTITWAFNDRNGNISTATQQVIVDDVTAPVIAATEPVNAPAEPGQCGVMLSITAPEVTDNCAARTATGTRDDGAALDAQYPVGTTTITWNATDANGNEAIAVTQTVTVMDTQAPTITVPADVEVAADASCQASKVELGTPTTADNCSVASVTNNAPATYELGETEVIWTVTDAAGLTATATQLVTVVDKTAPVLTASADQVVSLNAACSVSIPDVKGTATDNCSAVAITQSPVVGAIIAATHGQPMTVTVTATDAAGNSTSEEVVLTAQDIIAPVITAATDQSSGTDSGTCSARIAVPNAAFSDNCAGSQLSWIMTGATTGNGQGQVGSYIFNKGVTSILYTATDAAGNTATDQLIVTITDDEAPVVTVPANIVVQTQSDKCGAVVNYSVSASDNCSTITPEMTTGFASGATFPVGTTTVTYKGTDEANNATTQSFTVTVENNDPSNLVISGPPSPVQLGSEVSLSATFEDDNIATATWDWGNGTTTSQAISGSPITATYKYAQTGVYTVGLRITDHCGRSTFVQFNYVVIFDPTGGFVTGGGWIESPVDAMLGDKYGVTGRANFGFNAKYKNGKTTVAEVEGHTNFQFKAGDLHFSSFEHEDMSLVIAGKKATYTGFGTVNGSGNHRFRVIAIDGQADGGTGPDQFRIKIWGNGSNSDSDVLYDNHRGVSESSDIATTIAGGSIVIHKPVKTSSTKSSVAAGTTLPETLDKTELYNYPNTFSDRTTIVFRMHKSETYQLEVYDLRGELIKRVDMGVADAGKLYEYEFDGSNLAEGMYIARLMTSSGMQSVKMILRK